MYHRDGRFRPSLWYSVGADDPVRPYAHTSCRFVGGDAHIAPSHSAANKRP